MSHRNTFYYDQASNVTCVRDDDLGLTYYTYDLLNRTTLLKNPFGEVTYYEYLDCGQVSKRTLGNGCLTYYEYDVKGRVAKIDHRESDMTQIAELAYEYDKVGNPTKITREDESATYYDYDKTYQLTDEVQVDNWGTAQYDFAYEYDGAHNRTVKVDDGTPTYYTYNAANQMLTETTGAATTYYHYDGCGNTTAEQAPAGTTYYEYDTENLMTRIDFPDDTHSYYTYDADSKRVSQRTADGYSEFIYQGPDMLALQVERDENGDTKVQYTMGNGLEAMRRDAGGGIASGDSSFYHYNHLGTTMALTNAAESVSDTYRHDAWGVQLASTGSTVNPHTYVGRERYFRMPNAGLYHLGFRDYAQRAGRFTTTDPIRYGANWFAYVSNGPVGRTDSAGLFDPPGPPAITMPPVLPPESCLPTGKWFRLRHPELLCAVLQFEWSQRNPITDLQDLCASCGYARGFTFGEAQFSIGTIRSIEGGFLDNPRVPNDIRMHLKPSIEEEAEKRGITPDEEALRRALDPHWAKAYLGAWIYLWEMQRPDDPMGFVHEWWNNSNKEYRQRWDKCGPKLMEDYGNRGSS